MRTHLLAITQDLLSRCKYRRGFWGTILNSLTKIAVVGLYLLISIIVLPVHVTKNPYESFQILARRNGSGQFIDSYKQHIMFQRMSISALILSISLVAIQIISVLLISFLGAVPEPTSAKDETACPADRSASGEIPGACLLDDTFSYGGVWFETLGGCNTQDLTWKYTNIANGQTTSMASVGTAFTVPVNPVTGVGENTLELQTVTCKAAGTYDVLIDIGGQALGTSRVYVGTPSDPSEAAISSTTIDSLNLTWVDNANNEEQYSIETADYISSCGSFSIHGTASRNAASYSIGSLDPNTGYCVRVRATNPAANSNYSTLTNLFTLASDPTITPNRSTASWYTSGSFGFSHDDVWGSGGVEYYRYAWSEEATHTWDGTETQWSSDQLDILPSTDSAQLYLHVKSYNANDQSQSSAVATFGPYFFDQTEPAIVDNETVDRGWLNIGGEYNVDFSNGGNGSSLTSAQYAVGTTAGGSNIIDWTDIFTDDQDAFEENWELNFNALPEGAHYVSVRASDVAGNTRTQNNVFQVQKDTQAATIGSLAASLGSNSITVSWTTSEAATSVLEWGTSQSLGQTMIGSEALSTSHSITLTNLDADSGYYFRARSDDRAGNIVRSSIQSDSTTEVPAETTITNVQAAVTGPNSATITWSTNHPATSRVQYGATTGYGSELSSSLSTTQHSLALTGLNAGTTYHYQVTSTGNTTAVGSDLSFATTQSTPAEPTPENDEEETKLPRLEPVPGPYIFDLPTPTVIQPEANQLVLDRQPLITGLAKSGNVIKVFIDGIYDGYAIASSDSTGTGNFSYTPFLKLSIGWHTLQVEAWSDNHRSAKSPTRSFEIPTPFVAPTVTKQTFSDGDNPELFLQGVARNNSRIKIFVDGIEFDEIIVSENTSGTSGFSIDVAAKGTLSDGDHAVTLIAYNDQGRASPETAPIIFTKKSIKNKPGKTATVFTQPVTYVVESGDSLWKIAEKLYGDGSAFTKIVVANTAGFPSLESNPSLLLPGWSLTVPPL
ncbi:MAG: LysM peptidoglycan-binding domain-containing protein [bacterium]|nr:LysM peptidoglycan-binding domain-containing protein [bacterium]